MRKQFEVKEKSLTEFFRKYVPSYNRQDYLIEEIYKMFQTDEPIYIKKSDELKNIMHVIFEIEDTTYKTRKTVKYAYEYLVQEYDDVLNKLVFIG
jgi:hypothetical protein